MRHQSSYKILTIGPTAAPRYVIMSNGNASDDIARYWTGKRWSGHLGKAILYAERSIAWRAIVRLRGTSEFPF